MCVYILNTYQCIFPYKALYGCCVVVVIISGGGGGSIVTRLWARQLSYCGLVSDSGQGFFSSQICPDQPWGLVGLLFVGTGDFFVRMKSPICKANHSHPSSAVLFGLHSFRTTTTNKTFTHMPPSSENINNTKCLPF